MPFSGGKISDIHITAIWGEQKGNVSAAWAVPQKQDLPQVIVPAQDNLGVEEADILAEMSMSILTFHHYAKEISWIKYVLRLNRQLVKLCLK